jgi:hypothetical protein
MQIKCISFCLSLFFLASQTTFATPLQMLISYDAIRNHLLQGSKIKVITDNKDDCKLQTHEGSLSYAPNMFGTDIGAFTISYKSGDIGIPLLNVFNAPDEKYPGNYQNIELWISHDNVVKIISKAVSLPDQKIFSSTTEICTIAKDRNATGLKFLVV